MNGICRDWMLIESKRPIPPPLVVEPIVEVSVPIPGKRMSIIEQKLMGVNFIQDQ